MRHLVIDLENESPVYIQIMDQLRARVGDATLPPGSPLPSVRQLASELEVNPNTVAKAYMLLEREGILRTLSRRGTFVAESADASAARGVDRRLEEAVGRLLAEIAHLGVDDREVLEALRRSLGAKQPRTPSGDEER
ncbi:MAG: GntR family transcriptional regulator [Gemmatimonadota bacterium]